MKQLCLQAETSYTGERIDKYLAEVMSDYSRSFLQKQLKDGNVTVNGKKAKASYKVAEEDEITVLIPDNTSKCWALLRDLGKCPDVSL